MAQLRWRSNDGPRLAATFNREGAMTGKRALRHMRRVSQLVMKESIALAPVDHHGPDGEKSAPLFELEKAHKIVEQYDGRRIAATIEVGGMVGDVDVDLYATWIHEGNYKLGKGSEAKATSTGKDVGPHFLERALQEHDDKFEGLLDELLQGLLG
jgi:hypothetical protein